MTRTADTRGAKPARRPSQDAAAPGVFIDTASGSAATVARHRVRQRLQEMIFSGQMKSGQKLVQRDLARRFNVGQGVIREALFELRGSGLVDSIDNRGVFVGQNSRRRILESYEVRGVLEGLAMRLCCEQITRAQIRELEEMAMRIFELATGGKRDEAAALDRELHLRLIRIAGNEVLIGLMEQDRFLTKVVWTTADDAATRDQHLNLLKAIAENRPDDAERNIRDQMALGRKIIERHLQLQQEPVRWVR